MAEQSSLKKKLKKILRRKKKKKKDQGEEGGGGKKSHKQKAAEVSAALGKKFKKDKTPMTRDEEIDKLTKVVSKATRVGGDKISGYLKAAYGLRDAMTPGPDGQMDQDKVARAMADFKKSYGAFHEGLREVHGTKKIPPNPLEMSEADIDAEVEKMAGTIDKTKGAKYQSAKKALKDGYALRQGMLNLKETKAKGGSAAGDSDSGPDLKTLFDNYKKSYGSFHNDYIKRKKKKKKGDPDNDEWEDPFEEDDDNFFTASIPAVVDMIEKTKAKNAQEEADREKRLKRNRKVAAALKAAYKLKQKLKNAQNNENFTDNQRAALREEADQLQIQVGNTRD
jgi:hypothetical protein